MTDREIEEYLKAKQPALWSACYPRAYESRGNYGSPKRAALGMAMNKIGHDSMGPAADDPTKYASLTTIRLIEHSVPTYFVAAPLLHACLETTPPDQFNYTDLKWPMPAMLFVLPKGTLASPKDGSCDFIAIARHAPEAKEIRVPGLPPIRRLVEEACFSYFAYSETGMTYAGYAPTHGDPTLVYMLAGDRNYSPGIMDISATGEPIFETISGTDSEFLGLIQSIGLRLLLILNARPDLLSLGYEIRKANLSPKKSSIALWSPNVIGEHFRAATASRAHSDDSPRTSASPRMHWRRGHYRSQPHGAGFTLRRIIWIEPVLVAFE